MIAIRHSSRWWDLTHVVALATGCTAMMAHQSFGQTYQSSVLSSNPHAYWRFEDASTSEGATATDISGNSHHGAYIGSPPLITPPHGGSAPSLSGAGQYVEIGPSLAPFGSSLGNAATFEFLFRSTDTTTDRVFGTFNTGNNTTVVFTSNSNYAFQPTPGHTQLYMRREGNGALEAHFDSTLVNIYDGQWHHVVWRIDQASEKGVGTQGAPADMSVYKVTVDDMDIPLTYRNTFATTATFADFNQPFRIGAAGRATPFAETLEGSIDEFAIYNRLLTDTEISNHMSAWLDELLLPGDFNNDNVVNALDYFVLSNNLAAHLDRVVTFEDGDFNFDGRVDLDDFALFKESYPQVVLAATTVPEPATIATLLSLSLVYTLVRRRTA